MSLVSFGCNVRFTKLQLGISCSRWISITFQILTDRVKRFQSGTCLMCDNVDIHIHLKSKEVKSISGQTSLVSVLPSTGTVFLSMLSLLVLWIAPRTAWIHVQSGAFKSDSLLSRSLSSSHILLFCFSSLPCGPCGFYLGHVKKILCNVM